MKNINSKDPIDHAQNIKSELEELADHLRRDVEKVEDEKAKALFETSAEVLLGLLKAFDDFIERKEPAWTEKNSAQKKSK